MNISKWFKEKYGKGDFSIVEDKLVYETQRGALIEANLPDNVNKTIKNDMIEEEVKKMPKKEKKETKNDLTEDSEANMDAKYVKLTESHEGGDPEVEEAARKHIDMEAEEAGEMEAEAKDKKKKIPEDGEEAGEMEAETPNKKNADFDNIISKIKEDFSSQLKPLMEKIEKQEKLIKDMNQEKIAEKQKLQEDLIEGMSEKMMVPQEWVKGTSEKYGGLKGDFIQDLYEGLSYAFGTIPGYETEAKEDMKKTGLLRVVEGL